MLISFLFLDENICFGYSLEAPLRGVSNKYPQRMFSLRNKKNIMWIPLLSVAMQSDQSSLKICIHGYPNCTLLKFKSDCTNALAYPSLCLAHMVTYLDLLVTVKDIVVLLFRFAWKSTELISGDIKRFSCAWHCYRFSLWIPTTLLNFMKCYSNDQHGLRWQKTYLWTCAQNENSDQHVHLHSLIRIFTTVLSTSLGKTFFAWCFILNENILFWLTIPYQEPFVFSVSVFYFQICTLKLNLSPEIGLTYAISIVKWFFGIFVLVNIFYFSLLNLNY